MIDTSCLTALLLVIARNVLDVFTTSRTFYFYNNDDSQFTFEDLAELNPDYIKLRFEFDTANLELFGFATMVNALATFAFFVPLLQVSWILSDGGKRRVASQALVLVLALAGGMCELIVSLMLLGIRSTAVGWIGSDTFFNLDDWLGEDNGDMIGWRVLEVIYTVLNGLTTWINAFEWISIFGIMVILFLTVRAENKYTRGGAETFGMKWASLGLVIGFLGLLEFIAELLRLRSWLRYMRISFWVRSLNMFVFVPIYLIVLSRQLPAIKESFEEWNTEAGKPLNPDANTLNAAEVN